MTNNKIGKLKDSFLKCQHGTVFWSLMLRERLNYLSVLSIENNIISHCHVKR